MSHIRNYLLVLNILIYYYVAIFGAVIGAMPISLFGRSRFFPPQQRDMRKGKVVFIIDG